MRASWVAVLVHPFFEFKPPSYLVCPTHGAPCVGHCPFTCSKAHTMSCHAKHLSAYYQFSCNGLTGDRHWLQTSAGTEPSSVCLAWLYTCYFFFRHANVGISHCTTGFHIAQLVPGHLNRLPTRLSTETYLARRPVGFRSD